jgi:hypothetical protein
MSEGLVRETAGTAPPPTTQIVILIGGPEEARRTGAKVIAPARLLRAWRRLTMLDREVHAGRHDDAESRRIGRLFDQVRGEILASVSAPLAEEAHRLIPALGERPGPADTRIACSGTLAWLDSLVTSMLLQLGSEAAPRPVVPRPAPARPRRIGGV